MQQDNWINGFIFKCVQWPFEAQIVLYFAVVVVLLLFFLIDSLSFRLEKNPINTFVFHNCLPMCLSVHESICRITWESNHIIRTRMVSSAACIKSQNTKHQEIQELGMIFKMGCGQRNPTPGYTSPTSNSICFETFLQAFVLHLYQTTWEFWRSPAGVFFI